MWYEILPSFGIVVGVLMVPGVSNWVINRLFLGKDSIRHWGPDMRTFNGFLRDQRMTGNALVVQGLEALPEPEPKSK